MTSFEQINWPMTDKQEFIDIVETVYRGARKGRGLVVSPKGEHLADDHQHTVYGSDYPVPDKYCGLQITRPSTATEGSVQVLQHATRLLGS